MKQRRTNSGGWGPEYHMGIAFRAPMDFVFAWCTDFTPGDPKLENEEYQRKVIQRTSGRVILEDLEESKDGWIWSREVVSLHPPKRWHMDGVGNRRDVVADYALSSLPDGRTRLDLRWRRKPNVPGGQNLTRAEREASAKRAWKRFGAALERDYRASIARGKRSK